MVVDDNHLEQDTLDVASMNSIRYHKTDTRKYRVIARELGLSFFTKYATAVFADRVWRLNCHRSENSEPEEP